MCRDRKKKKYVGESNNVKMVRTESGSKVPITYKSNRYKDWSSKNHVAMSVCVCVRVCVCVCVCVCVFLLVLVVVFPLLLPTPQHM